MDACVTRGSPVVVHTAEVGVEGPMGPGPPADSPHCPA